MKEESNGSEISVNNNYAELLRRISENIANVDEKVSGCSGWIDMRNFVNDAKMLAVILGTRKSSKCSCGKLIHRG